MTNHNTFDAKYTTALQELYLDSVLSGCKPTLNLTSLEPDRRRHSKLAREFTNQAFIKLIAPESFSFLICEAILESLPNVAIDLCQIWQKRLDHNASEAEQRAWIRIDRFDTAQKKTILQSEDLDFFAVCREAYSQWSKFAEEPRTILPDSSNQFEQYWDGPFDTISAALKLISGQATLILAVSSPTLRDYVESELQARKLAALYQANALWGLVECGIIDQHIVFDNQDQPLINPQFRVPSFPFISSTHDTHPSPEAWENNLNTSISQLESQVANLTQRLTTVQLIAQNINRFGGWEKFKQCYSEKLRQHLQSGH